MSESSPLVSIIVPVYNAAMYLNEALESIARQTYRPLEVVFYDDFSKDDSRAIIATWVREQQEQRGFSIPSATIVCTATNCECPTDQLEVMHCQLGDAFYAILTSGKENHGPGYARNRAIALARGSLLCHFDSDDIMDARRVQEMFLKWKQLGSPEDILIGCNFNRLPADSTPYYTTWLNSLSEHDLLVQQYRECTIICPSWFYPRKLFEAVATKRMKSSSVFDSTLDSASRDALRKVPDLLTHLPTGPYEARYLCGFVESSPETLERLRITRVPEDLLFFLDHLEIGGRISKVHETLVTYRYSPGSWALGTPKQDLARIRVEYIERRIIGDFPRIWNFSNQSNIPLTAEEDIDAVKCKRPRLDGTTICISSTCTEELKSNSGSSSMESSVIEDTKQHEDAGAESSHKSASSRLCSFAGPHCNVSVASEWTQFSIWGYGKDGRKFLGMLQPATALRVSCFIDVDPKKIGMKYFCNRTRRHIPVIHYSQAKPPFIVCVGSKRPGGELEQNIKSLGLELVEGFDYFHFS